MLHSVSDHWAHTRFIGSSLNPMTLRYPVLYDIPGYSSPRAGEQTTRLLRDRDFRAIRSHAFQAPPGARHLALGTRFLAATRVLLHAPRPRTASPGMADGE